MVFDAAIFTCANDWLQKRSLLGSAVDIGRLHSESEDVIAIVVSVVDPDCHMELLSSLVCHVEMNIEGCHAYVTESHNSPYVTCIVSGSRTKIYVAPVSSSSLKKDEDLSKYLDRTSTGLKVAKDGVALRSLLVPRLHMYLHAESANHPRFLPVLSFLVHWAKSRGIFNTLDNGYLTVEILAVMLLHIHHGARDSTPSDIIRKFFLVFADWEFNEASVSSEVCNSAFPYASTISEEDGIDSDVDEEFRQKRLASRHRPPTSTESTVPTDDTHSHSLKMDEDDEVQVHKRTRAELGKIRDVRRIYSVPEYFARPIHVVETTSTPMKPLDWLDVMFVGHPLDESVNLAIRVQESHRKLIFQEIFRARFLLEDTGGDAMESISSAVSVPITRHEDIPMNLVITIKSDSKLISDIVCEYVWDQIWYLVQELQGFSGLMVVPPTGPVGHSTTSFYLGLLFPEEAPYCAQKGMKIDFMGPVIRAMTRCREKLKTRPDFKEKLEKRFIVDIGVQRR
jgi:hypothetical protein